MKKFMVTVTQEVELTLHDDVIAAVTDEWRGRFYNLNSVKEIAEHIAFNLVCNGARLSRLDGWADQPDSNAKIHRVRFGAEVEAEELKEVAVEGRP